MQLAVKDIDLRRWGKEINAHSQNKINFKASKSWLAKFKSNRRIVSRKITKFLGKSHVMDIEKVKADAAKFVEDIRNLIQVKYKNNRAPKYRINQSDWIWN